MAIQNDDERFRLDKWLWAARFYKTRSLAAEAVHGGKVHVDGVRAKPGRAVHVGDRLEVHKEPFWFEVEVLALSDCRGPASEAAKLYQESEESQRKRAEEASRLQLERQSRPQIIMGFGRPTKRDRRRLDRWSGE